MHCNAMALCVNSRSLKWYSDLGILTRTNVLQNVLIWAEQSLTRDFCTNFLDISQTYSTPGISWQKYFNLDGIPFKKKKPPHSYFFMVRCFY